MGPRFKVFGEVLGQAAIAKDWSAVRGMLAPWLPASRDAELVRAFFEDGIREILDGNLADASEIYVSGNSSTLADLRKKPSWKEARPIAPEVTEDNFRQWMLLRLLPTEEQAGELGVDFVIEIWCIVVELGGELRVGYWATDAN